MVTPLDDVAASRWIVESVTFGNESVGSILPGGYQSYVEIDYKFGRLWVLRDLLAEDTAPAVDCWYGIWEGWPIPDEWREKPAFHMPDGNYLLFSGKFTDLAEIATSFSVSVIEQGGSGAEIAGGAEGSTGGSESMSRKMRESGFYRQPSLWWPADRSWVVASDIDAETLYVACRSEMAMRILGREDLDARQVRRESRIADED